MITQRNLILLITLLLSSLLLPFAVANIVFGILLVLSVSYILKNNLTPVFTVAHLVWILLYLLMVLSLLWSIDIKESINALTDHVKILLISLLFGFLPPLKDGEKHQILAVFSHTVLIFAICILIRGLYRWLIHGSTSVLTNYQLVDFWGLNRVGVSIFMALAIFYFLLYSKHNIYVLLKMIVLGFTIILLSSKNIVVSTIVIASVLIGLKLNTRKQKLLLMIAVIPVALSIIWLSNTFNSSFISGMKPRFNEIVHSNHFGQNYYLNGAELRLLYTRFTYENITEDHTLFTGYGVGASQEKINTKIEAYDLYNGYKDYHTHNQFIEILSDLGLFGLLLLIVALGYAFYQYIIIKNYFALAFISIFIAYMMTDTPLYTQRNIYLFLVLYFIFLPNNKLNKTNT